MRMIGGFSARVDFRESFRRGTLFNRGASLLISGSCPYSTYEFDIPWEDFTSLINRGSQGYFWPRQRPGLAPGRPAALASELVSLVTQSYINTLIFFRYSLSYLLRLLRSD